MYNSVGPEVENSASADGSKSTIGTNDAISLWDIGRRLDEGKGV